MRAEVPGRRAVPTPYRRNDQPAPVLGGRGFRTVASNFAALFMAEVACRGVSMLVMLALTRRLLSEGFGRVEFAFNIVFWLVLIVRDGFEVIVTREVARHPRITRALVNRVLAVKLALAVTLLSALYAAATWRMHDPADVRLVGSYGLLLLTTSLGIDFVYRGKERMALVAVSLCVRTAVYAVGVFMFVTDVSRIGSVPLWLVGGEVVGIALVWAVYARQYGLPRLTPDLTFLRVILTRGRSVLVIQLSQAVLVTADLLVVGLVQNWSEVGRYSAPHRMISAAMAFGLIFQHAVFPSLSRSLRRSDEEGRALLDRAVRVLMLGYVPLAVGVTLLAGPLVAILLPAGFEQSAGLLAVGIWRAPLLSLAFLYQAALIAMNRESIGMWLLVGGALVSARCVWLATTYYGIMGASTSVLGLGVLLAAAGYFSLWREGRAPAWHHHLAVPTLGSLVMAPVCLWLKDVHIVAAVVGSVLVYGAVVGLLGGFRDLHFRETVGRGRYVPTPAEPASALPVMAD